MSGLIHYLDANQKIWNTRTSLNVACDFFDMRAFLNGRSTLTETELEELGNIQEMNTLHLQCHFGLDTLSLARLGAGVMGINFLETAPEQVRQLADQTGPEAEFHCCNVYDV